MNFFKILFFNTLILGTIISISSYSWFSMWMGLEINLLSFIPLINSSKYFSSTEASIKYFLIQALASLILLFSIISMMLKNEFISPTMDKTILLLLNTSLLTKMGTAPFHFWFPEVMEGLTWSNCLILLTWQKIAPMMLMMNNLPSMYFLMSIIMFSLIISTTLGINQTSLRKILTFSSINHMSWMISSMLISYSLWTLYFLIYTLMNLMTILFLQKSKAFNIKQLINSFQNNNMLKFNFMMNFIALAGLPPFIGFLPKWFLINELITKNMIMLTLMLIMLTLIYIFIYIRLIYSSFTFSFTKSKLKFKNINIKNLNLMIFITNLSLILFMFTFNSL